MANKTYDIIVVGAGPAGMTAAIYAARSEKSVLIIEKESFGGQMALAPKIENFPSIKSVSGEKLADMMMEQMMELGVLFELEEVEKLVKIENEFLVETNYNSYKSKAVIFATGATHRHIGVLNEEKYLGNGLSYCAVCDGAFYKGKEVAVIGDGNSALQYALDLANYCPKVYVCTLFDKFFGDQVLVTRLKQKENIIIKPNISLKNFIGDGSLESLEFENLKTKEREILDVKGVFIAIGQYPVTNVIKNLVELDKDGYVISDDLLLTKVEGLFVAGDCRTKNVRQVTTAISDGAVAACNAINYLNQ